MVPAYRRACRRDRCRDFDNWAIRDTLCFHLFDKSPHAWGKVGQWARRRAEFERRAAFALLAALALHDKAAPEARFRTSLPLIAAAATDERNFVKKGVRRAGALGSDPFLGRARLGVRPLSARGQNSCVPGA